METITLGAGCFWCVEGVFQRIKGVLKVSSGYSGGKSLNPTYEKVCGPYNDHVEVCQIVYDPSIISTKELLRVFFYTHDPTTINKQGNDIGYQYRSVIFYHSQEQKEIALKKIDELMNGGFFLRSIVTTVEPLAKFYPAEAYHQNYYNDNPQQPYCKAIIKPKLDKLKKLFKDQLK